MGLSFGLTSDFGVINKVSNQEIKLCYNEFIVPSCENWNPAKLSIDLNFKDWPYVRLNKIVKKSANNKTQSVKLIHNDSDSE